MINSRWWSLGSHYAQLIKRESACGIRAKPLTLSDGGTNIRHMFDSDLHQDDAATLARVHAVLDELSTLELTGRADGELLALWRDMESVRRRLAPIDHALIQEVQARHLAFACGAKSITVLARDVLRIGVYEASARVNAAEALGRRRSFTGELLAPVYPRVAAAQASGSVAEAAARVITGLIDKLPDAVRCEQDQQIETFLVQQASILDLDALRLIARRLQATLDPDGRLKDAEYRAKQRDLRFTVRPDGSSHGQFEGTAEFTEWLRTVLDAMARPKPEADGAKDPRTAGQRRHDGLLEAFKLLGRCQLLPDTAGVSSTVILTMNQDAFQSGKGTATTGHGVILPAKQVLMWLDGETKVVPVVFDNIQRITGIGTGQRLFSQRQRLAMIARDGGCSFPGCDAPPQWTQSHHVIEYADGGPTCTDNGTLLCGVHHREFARMGWQCHMTDGVPHWIPPAWIDATRTPRTNCTHDPTISESVSPSSAGPIDP